MEFGLTDPLVVTYALIVVRLSTALVVMPMCGATGVPPHTKIGLALFMGLVLVPLQEPIDLPPGMGPIIAVAIREGLIGFAMGFAVTLVFQSMEVAGSFVGVQMGLGLGQVFDPMTGAGSNELRRFYQVLATLIFFLVNAHHQVIAGLFGTFDILPLNTFSGDELNITAMIQISARMFISAVQIALPIVAALFMTDVALAVIARTMPQLNVLIVGMPVKIAVGLLMLMTALPATTR